MNDVIRDIGQHVKIGDDVKIWNFTYIGDNTEIGDARAVAKNVKAGTIASSPGFKIER